MKAQAELIRATTWIAGDEIQILVRWRDDLGLEFDAIHDGNGKPVVCNRHFRAPRITAEQLAAALEVFACEQKPPRHPAYDLAEKGAAAKPELAERMTKAADLVAGGKVLLHASNGLGVIGTVEGYSIREGNCTCADHQYRGGWCKHRLAVRMARSLGQATVPVPFASDAATKERERAEHQRIAREVREFNQRDRESWQAYCNSRYGSQRYIIKAVANGATTLPPEKWQKAYGGRDLLKEEYEL